MIQRHLLHKAPTGTHATWPHEGRAIDRFIARNVIGYNGLTLWLRTAFPAMVLSLLNESRRVSRILPSLLFCVFLTSCATLQHNYFSLRFVDSETGRGIPLVEAETTNRVRYVSDSAGRIAINPAELGSRTVFFHVTSHGYELPLMVGSLQGITVTLEPGQERVVTLNRLNIAERLYRVTGEGIYHDSQLLGASTPLPYETRPKGGVFGQDSVINAIYDNQLYWFWGDTRRAETPFGNFKVAGAVSPLNADNTYDASNAIDLTYFVAPDGFTRPMCPIDGAGPIWIHALFVVGAPGNEHMVCGYVRVNNSMERQEMGIARWNPIKQRFEKFRELPLDAPLYMYGHPFKVYDEGDTWFYFGHPVPDMRVRAGLNELLTPERYQGYTCLKEGSRWNEENPPLDRDEHGALVWGWKTNTDILTPSRWTILQDRGLVKPTENRSALIDQETGKQIIPHSGSVTWNEHRKRWVLVFGEVWGLNSFLGEVWYAEALDPEGPWSPAQKIVTHNRYSFYNVKQHPYFASGKYIYFEGTYTQTFSGNDQATPRYDYNQIMYRLDVDDPRLPRIADPKETNKRSNE